MGGAINVLAAIILFFFFAWIARRLLGVKRLSATRTLVSSLVGLAAGLLIGFYLHRRDFDIDSAALIGLALGLLFTMLTVIAFETVLGERRSIRVGSVRDRWAQIRRSGEITRIFGRHGLGDGLDLVRGRALNPEAARAFGVNLRDAFEEAGGVFVKLGQLLATRPDIVPAETAAELELLHSRVSPASEAEIRQALEQAVGPVESQFSEFDWTPLGSASIGQVYPAKLAAGDPVVVKVRRPGVAETINRDLDVLQELAGVAEARSKQARSMGLAAVVAEFSAQLREELDYRVEARNAEDVRHALKDHPSINVPEVLADLSSESVLVMRKVDGSPLGDLSEPPIHGRELAEDLFDAELDSMLSGNAFHADLHPGNILIDDTGAMGLVDFGAVGRLDAYERAAVSDILTALDLRDPTLLREAALEVGMRSGSEDVNGLDRALSRLMADHLSSDRDPSIEVITDFLRISSAHGLRMPASISEMLRALATLDGSLHLLWPDFAIVPAAQRVARRELVEHLNPETLSDDLKREVVRLAPILRRAPYQLDRISSQLARGEFGVRVSLFTTEDDTRWLGRIINRAILAFLGAVLGIVSVMLFQTTGGPELTANVSLFQLLGYIGLFGGAILVMRVILEVLREQ